MESRTVKILVMVEMETKSSIDDIKKGLTRGIYRGLDTEPLYIAQPKDVKINIVQKENV